MLMHLLANSAVPGGAAPHLFIFASAHQRANQAVTSHSVEEIACSPNFYGPLHAPRGTGSAGAHHAH